MMENVLSGTSVCVCVCVCVCVFAFTFLCVTYLVPVLSDVFGTSVERCIWYQC